MKKFPLNIWYMIILLVFLSYLTIFFSFIKSVVGEHASSNAILIDFNTNIDGGALNLWKRVIRIYSDKMLILKINSYGGYLSIADKIVADVIERNIICYAWIPPGGYAVSAASMVALSCRGIFMGSGSVIGDAIPIPSDQKTIEYVASRFRALARRMFGGNRSLIEVAEAMVREGKTLTVDEAIAIGFARRAESIKDLEDLLGVKIVEVVSLSAWDMFISIVSLPIVAEILLIAGLLLTIAEILTAGFQGYAIAGALLIILALYGMNIVPPDVFALILMLMGLVLLAIEMYTPGFGLFGLIGIIVLVTGFSYQLYLTPSQLLTEPVYVILGGMITLTFIASFIVFKAVQTARRKRVPLDQQLLTSVGIAKTDIHETIPGVVYILGEDWTAYSINGVIPAGSKVSVVRVEGLKLYVKKADQ